VIKTRFDWNIGSGAVFHDNFILQTKLEPHDWKRQDHRRVKYHEKNLFDSNDDRNSQSFVEDKSKSTPEQESVFEELMR